MASLTKLQQQLHYIYAHLITTASYKIYSLQLSRQVRNKENLCKKKKKKQLGNYKRQLFITRENVGVIRHVRLDNKQKERERAHTRRFTCRQLRRSAPLCVLIPGVSSQLGYRRADARANSDWKPLPIIRRIKQRFLAVIHVCFSLSISLSAIEGCFSKSSA